MNPLDVITKARRDSLSPTDAIFRTDNPWLGCAGCRTIHKPRESNLLQDMADWYEKHSPSKPGSYCVPVLAKPDDVERLARRIERGRRALRLSRRYAHNSNVNIAWQGSTQSLSSLTHFNSLADSSTAGWGSQAVDNTSNLYLDYHTSVTLAAVNTAPSNYKAFYIFFGGALDVTLPPTTGATSGGTLSNSTTADSALTFPDITTTQQQSLLPQTGQPINGQPIQYFGTNTQIQTPVFPMALYFGGNMPRFFWYAMVNHSGMTIAGSGNAWNYRGLFLTVV